jgi:hypothetical protein
MKRLLRLNASHITLLDKCLHTMEQTIMDTIGDQFDDNLESERDTIRRSLDAIANDVGMAIRNVV